MSEGATTSIRGQTMQTVMNRMDIKAVKECLEQRYAPKGTELEWQLKLQTRVQQ